MIGPAKLAETVLPYLERSKRAVVMNMTSGLASVGLDCGPKCTAYSISKTALNMLVCLRQYWSLSCPSKRISLTHTDLQASQRETERYIFRRRPWLGENRSDTN